MSVITFKIRKSKWRQKYWFTIVHSNGNVLAHSENYSRYIDAFTAAETIRHTAEYAAIENLT
jgi:uncharacterized protein YegP (UPF0339 family)